MSKWIYSYCYFFFGDLWNAACLQLWYLMQELWLCPIFTLSFCLFYRNRHVLHIQITICIDARIRVEWFGGSARFSVLVNWLVRVFVCCFLSLFEWAYGPSAYILLAAPSHMLISIVESKGMFVWWQVGWKVDFFLWICGPHDLLPD